MTAHSAQVPYTLVWQQEAFWYLAGLHDGDRRGPAARARTPFPYGPTTPAGREFIRAYVDANRADDCAYLYLPDFYAEWKRQRAGAA